MTGSVLSTIDLIFLGLFKDVPSQLVPMDFVMYSSRNLTAILICPVIHYAQFIECEELDFPVKLGSWYCSSRDTVCLLSNIGHKILSYTKRAICESVLKLVNYWMWNIISPVSSKWEHKDIFFWSFSTMVISLVWYEMQVTQTFVCSWHLRNVGTMIFLFVCMHTNTYTQHGHAHTHTSPTHQQFPELPPPKGGQL